MAKIKLIIFDFDGVLADCKELHFSTLNQALAENGYSKISWDEHIAKFDGLPTDTKLTMLGISDKEPVKRRKQELTILYLHTYLRPNPELGILLTKLSTAGYKLTVVSNAMADTVIEGLHYLGVKHLIDFIYAGSHMYLPKPYPGMYWGHMVYADALPQETLIIEDSKVGRLGAMRSGAHVCGVDNPKGLTLERITKAIEQAEKTEIPTKWTGKDVNILIPMAGAGSRFSKMGYRLPKPLIDVAGKPMIQRVVENLNIDGNYIFVVQKAHYEEHHLGLFLPLIAPGCKIIQTDGLTDGAACTTLLAQEFIDNDEHLLIANADQYVEWDVGDFLYRLIASEADGGILTFSDSDPKWSFIRSDGFGNVTETAEKTPISDIASCGIYYFKHGSDYVKFAKQRIAKNIRFNNEFYVCPTYNECIEAGKRIKHIHCDAMHGLGTPEDLESFLKKGIIDGKG